MSKNAQCSSICEAVDCVKIFFALKLDNDPSCPLALKSVYGHPSVPRESLRCVVWFKGYVASGGNVLHEAGEPLVDGALNVDSGV